MLSDLSYAARALIRRPGHTALAVATAAVGIGVTTALFSVVHGVLLRPLPWPNADRLVRVAETREGGTPRRPWLFTSHTYQAWAQDPQTIEGLAGWRSWTATLTDAGDPERLPHARVTPGIFDVLRARPIAGRLFTASDAEQGGVIVLSEGLWEERFGREPEAIGRAVRLDGEPYRIVGVVSRDFAFPDRETRAWLPLDLPPAIEGENTSILSALALLKPGFTPRQASEEATARAATAPRGGPIEVGFFGSSGTPRVTATPLLESTTAEVRPALLLLLSAVGLLLVAAVANVAGLQLTAATARQRELALRSAIGAGRGRLMRLLLTESTLLGLAGGAAGLALAVGIVRTLPTLLPAGFPRAEAITVDGRVAGFALASSLLAGVLFGLLPALFAGRAGLAAVLAVGGSGSLGAGRSATARARTSILVAQTALAAVLLLAGLQLSRSFFAQLGADRGYEPAGLLAAELTLPEGLYTDVRREQIVSTLLRRLRGRPEVAHVAVTNLHPLSPFDTFGVFPARSHREGNGGGVIEASIRVASPGYFEALGRRLVAGRLLRESDSGAARPALVVNRTFADRYLEEPAVGSLLASYGDRPDYEVVGIVEDVRAARLSEVPRPEVVGALLHVEGLQLSYLTLLVRTRQDPGAFVPTFRALLREQDPALVPDRVRPMTELLGDDLAQPRLYSLLMGGFGLCALVIVGSGLFGVLSHTVSLRRREIGVRVAVGARPLDVVGLIGRRATTPAALGLALGLACSVLGSPLLERFLYGVRSHDAASVIAVAAVLGAVTVLASALPARKAARIAPQQALREG